jgi:hypothetical protein
MIRADQWNVTADEVAAHYPCEIHARPPFNRFLRAVDIDAPPEIVFRWLCQLKIAPYSYDWIDNLGRRSPARLTPGADHLEVGQRLMIGPVVDFEYGRHLTVEGGRWAERLFGPVTLTYQVRDLPGRRSRLVGCVCATAGSPAARLRRMLLDVGDLIMMRKQLLTLKAHAEHQYRAAVA